MSNRDAPSGFRVQGFDAPTIVSQIIALQSLHYLTLVLICPISLNLLANGPDLDREGGAYNVAMIVDWREMAGKSTVISLLDKDWLSPLFHAGQQARSWTLAFCWLLTALADILYLFYLVRKPTHVLDFSITLLFFHVIITTYYAGTFPTSVFWWIVVLASTVAEVIIAEQLCIKREMRDGLGLVWKPDEDSSALERSASAFSAIPPRLQRRNSAPSMQLGHLRAGSLPVPPSKGLYAPVLN